LFLLKYQEWVGIELHLIEIFWVLHTAIQTTGIIDAESVTLFICFLYLRFYQSLWVENFIYKLLQCLHACISLCIRVWILPNSAKTFCIGISYWNHIFRRSVGHDSSCSVRMNISSPWPGFNSQPRDFSLADHTLRQLVAENGSISPQWHHPTSGQRGGRPKFSHGQTMAQIKKSNFWKPSYSLSLDLLI